MSDEYENGSVVEKTEYTDEEMHALIDGTMTDFDEGDLVSGTIVKVERDEVLLDIGYKSEGVIPARELSIRKDANPGDIVSVGDAVEALVLQKEDKDGRLILSKKRAEYERAWTTIEEKFNVDENVSGEVIEVVKGGLILDIGLRGFLPASLVDLRRVKDLASFLGDTLEARVIEMDRNRNNVVLSRRVVLEEGRKEERAAILGKLAKGQILPGAVSSIVDFGAFVDLGGIDGLVHISELSWSHVNHPSEVVKVGDEVNVQVLEVDMDRERISLGLKQTTEDPWKQLVKKFPVGSIIEGTVTKLVPFGAFVELGDGVEGLVHISEMARGHVETPEQVTAVGQNVHIKVMDVDLDRRRISLSMRAAGEALGTVIEMPAREDAEEGAEEAVAEVEATEAVEGAEEAVEVEAAEVAEAEEAVEVEAEEVAEAEEAVEVEAEEVAEAAEVAEAEAVAEAEEAVEVEAEEVVEEPEVAEEAAEEAAEEVVEAEEPEVAEEPEDKE
ncbi:MAG: 30S ribosomal protein S1 [Actinomycetota bacterium]|nr:30S ribosomal protein S1 [Actinomycetota bacterium]